MRELYAKMAESLKKLLVSELSSWSGDMETMVAWANKAFKTLDWLQPDYTEFYDAVRSLLSLRTQLSSLETLLRTHQNEEESDAGNIQARSKEALEVLARSEAEYKKLEQIPKPRKSNPKIKYPNPKNETRKKKKKINELSLIQ